MNLNLNWCIIKTSKGEIEKMELPFECTNKINQNERDNNIQKSGDYECDEPA